MVFSVMSPAQAASQPHSPKKKTTVMIMQQARPEPQYKALQWGVGRQAAMQMSASLRRRATGRSRVWGMGRAGYDRFAGEQESERASLDRRLGECM